MSDYSEEEFYENEGEGSDDESYEDDDGDNVEDDGDNVEDDGDNVEDDGGSGEDDGDNVEDDGDNVEDDGGSEDGDGDDYNSWMTRPDHPHVPDLPDNTVWFTVEHFDDFDDIATHLWKRKAQIPYLTTYNQYILYHAIKILQMLHSRKSQEISFADYKRVIEEYIRKNKLTIDALNLDNYIDLAQTYITASDKRLVIRDRPSMLITRAATRVV